MQYSMRYALWVPVILGVLAWRNSHRAILLFPLPDFPEGYYAHGDIRANCTPLNTDAPEFRYCEDTDFWDIYDASGRLERRRVLFSCDPGRKAWNTVMGPLRDPAPHGALWIYNPDTAPMPPQRLILTGFPVGYDFHPLGIAAAPSHGGAASNLYVINHARARSVIEHFTLAPTDPTFATWVRTVTPRGLVSPNALALTSPTSFYVSNDHLFTRRLPAPLGALLPALETTLALPLGWLAHVTLNPLSPAILYDVSIPGLSFPNGVALSLDGTTLAVALSARAEVFLYTRNPATHALSFQAALRVPFAPDNLHFDARGALVVAGHPRLRALQAVARGRAGAVAPSWVVVFTPDDGAKVPADDARVPVVARVPQVDGWRAETLLQSDGAGFSTSSTGLRDERTGALYVSGLYAEVGALDCRPNGSRP